MAHDRAPIGVGMVRSWTLYGVPDRLAATRSESAGGIPSALRCASRLTGKPQRDTGLSHRARCL